MDVTKSNFAEALAILDTLLPRAEFVAIDEEMTGIEIASQRETLIDTMNTRYEKKRAVASTYGMIQFGLAVFTYEDGEYVAYPFNFYVFPDESNHGGIDPQITLSASSIAFNRKHGMNWNRWIDEGVTYATKRSMEQYDKKAKEDLEKYVGLNVPLASSPLASINPSSMRPVTLTKEEDAAQLQSMCDNFFTWVESVMSPDYSADQPKSYDFQPCNSFLRLALMANLSKTCKYIPASNETTHAAALAEAQKLKETAEAKAAEVARLKDRLQQAQQDSIENGTEDESESLGQRIEKAETRAAAAAAAAEAAAALPACDPERVIERMPYHVVLESKSGADRWSNYLTATVFTPEEREAQEAKNSAQRANARQRVLGASSLLGMFEKHKTTLVGHNCVYDIFFMFAGFQELPNSLSLFSAMYRRVVNQTFDTKLLFTSTFYQRLPWAIQTRGGSHLGIIYDAFLAAQRQSQGKPIITLPLDAEENSVAQSTEPATLPFTLPSVYTGPRSIRFAHGYTKYDESSALFHEAGYDAFCTGFVFVHLAHAFGCAAFTAMPHFPRDRSAPLYASRLHVDTGKHDEVMGAVPSQATTVTLVRPEGPVSKWWSQVPALSTLANQCYMMRSLFCIRFVSEEEAAEPVKTIRALHQSGLEAEWIAQSLVKLSSAEVTTPSQEEAAAGSQTVEEEKKAETEIQSWVLNLSGLVSSLEELETVVPDVPVEFPSDAMEITPSPTETESTEARAASAKTLKRSIVDRMHTGIMLGYNAGIILVLSRLGNEVTTEDVCRLLDISPTLLKWNDNQSLFIILNDSQVAQRLKNKVLEEFLDAADMSEDDIASRYPLGVWKLDDFHEYAAAALRAQIEKREQAAVGSKRVKM